MKQQLNGVKRHSIPFAFTPLLKTTSVLMLFACVITSCQKHLKESVNDMQSMNAKNTQAEVLNFYSGFLHKQPWNYNRHVLPRPGTAILIMPLKMDTQI